VLAAFCGNGSDHASLGACQVGRAVCRARLHFIDAQRAKGMTPDAARRVDWTMVLPDTLVSAVRSPPCGRENDRAFPYLLFRANAVNVAPFPILAGLDRLSNRVAG
jgi:hypothetical protein